MAAAMGERNTEDSRRKGAAIKAGLARRRASGRRTGGQSYGLTWRRNENDERETVPDPAQAPIVERIYAEYLAGRNAAADRQGAERRRHPSLRGRKWHGHVISSVLANPLYAGFVRDGEELIEAEHERDHRRASAGRRRRRCARHTPRRTATRPPDPRPAPLPPGLPALRRVRRGDRAAHRAQQGRHPARNLPLPWPLHRPCQLLDDRSARRADRLRRLRLLRAGRPRRRGHPRPARAPPPSASVAEVIALLRRRRARGRPRPAARLDRVKRDYADRRAERRRVARAPRRARAAGRGRRGRARPARRPARRDQGRARSSTTSKSELLAQLAHIRAVVAGEVNDADGVDGVRAALLRLFDRFILHRGRPERPTSS